MASPDSVPDPARVSIRVGVLAATAASRRVPPVWSDHLALGDILCPENVLQPFSQMKEPLRLVATLFASALPFDNRLEKRRGWAQIGTSTSSLFAFVLVYVDS